MPAIREVAVPPPKARTARTDNNQQPVADNRRQSVPAAHRYVPLPTQLPASTPPIVKPTKARTVNGQRIGSQRNRSAKASRKRITSLFKQQIIPDHTLLQPAGVNKAFEKQVKRAEPIFTYHLPSPKGSPAPAPITQDEEELERVSKPSTLPGNS